MRRSLLELKAMPERRRRKKTPAAISLEVFETFFYKKLEADPRFQQGIRSLFDKALSKNKSAVLTVMSGSWIGKQQSVEMLIDVVSRQALLQEEDQETRNEYRSLFSQFEPEKHVLVWLVNAPLLYEDEYRIPEDFDYTLLALALPRTAEIDVPAALIANGG